MQAQVINLLAELKKDLGLTLLFIAHDLSMVRYVSDRMAVMYLGSLIELGPSDEVFFRPKHPYTQLLVASNPEPDPALARTPRPTMSGEIPLPGKFRGWLPLRQPLPRSHGTLPPRDSAPETRGGRRRGWAAAGGLPPLSLAPWRRTVPARSVDGNCPSLSTT